MKVKKSVHPPREFALETWRWRDAPDHEAEAPQSRQVPVQPQDAGHPAFRPSAPQHWPRIFPGL